MALSCLHKAYAKLGSTRGAELLTHSLRKAWIHTWRGAACTKLTQSLDRHMALSCLHKAYAKLGSTHGAELRTQSLREDWFHTCKRSCSHKSLRAAWHHTRRGAAYTKPTRSVDPHTARSYSRKAYARLGTTQRAGTAYT